MEHKFLRYSIYRTFTPSGLRCEKFPITQLEIRVRSYLIFLYRKDYRE